MKNKIKKWLYEFYHGHPFLLEEEVDIIIKTRENPKFKHLNDREIKTLIEISVIEMYETKYPNAKRFTFPNPKTHERNDND